MIDRQKVSFDTIVHWRGSAAHNQSAIRPQRDNNHYDDDEVADWNEVVS